MVKIPPGIRLRGDTYYGNWTDELGKRVERRLSSDLRRAIQLRSEAIRRVERIRAGLDDIADQTQEVRPLVDRFIRDLRARVKAKHAHDTEVGLRGILDRMRVHAVSDITPERIQRAMLAMVEEGAANRTANKYLAFLMSWGRWAVRLRLIPRNPVDGVAKLPVHGRHKRRTRRRLTLLEAQQLQEAADKFAVGDVVALILGTGMRLEEALQTTWGDIEGTSIVIPAERTKTGRGRIVPIGDSLLTRLKAMRSRQALRLGEVPGPEQPVCRTQKGNRRWTQSGAYHALRRAMAAADIPHRRASDNTVLDWHALRHTYATMIAETGASETTLQALLGWADGKMAAVYVDPRRAPARHAVAELERLRATLERGKGVAGGLDGDAS